MEIMKDSEGDGAGLFGDDISLEDSDTYARCGLEDDLQRLAQAVVALDPDEQDLLFLQLFDNESLKVISHLSNSLIFVAA